MTMTIRATMPIVMTVTMPLTMPVIPGQDRWLLMVMNPVKAVAKNFSLAVVTYCCYLLLLLIDCYLLFVTMASVVTYCLLICLPHVLLNRSCVSRCLAAGKRIAVFLNLYLSISCLTYLCTKRCVQAYTKK